MDGKALIQLRALHYHSVMLYANLVLAPPLLPPPPSLSSPPYRAGNIFLGEPSRRTLLGMDGEAVQQLQAQAQAYRRPAGSKAGQRADKKPFSLDSVFQALGSGGQKKKVVRKEGGTQAQGQERKKRVVRRSVSTKKVVEESADVTSKGVEKGAKGVAGKKSEEGEMAEKRVARRKVQRKAALTQ